LFKAAINDSSYTVSGNALLALAKVDSAAAISEAKKLAVQPAKGKLAEAITHTLIRFGDESSADIILGNFEKMPLSQAKLEALQPLAEFLTEVKDITLFKRAIDDIVKFRDDIPEAFRSQTNPFINGIILKGLLTKKKEAGMQEQADYILSKLPEEDKKGI